MTTPVHVLVFGRSPVAGRAKTRLIPALGAAAAARIYGLLLRHALATAMAARLDAVELWVDGEPVAEEVHAIASDAGAAVRLQQGVDLGARMHHALTTILAAGALPLLMGSDVPALTPAMLRQGAAWLQAGKDLVVAPAEDGGYGLIGISRPLPELFQAMSWGGPQVWAETRLRSESLGLSLGELDTVWDVDVPEDLDRLDALPALRDWRRRIGCEVGS